MNLSEITQIIKHRQDSIQLNFWDIGNDLVSVKEKKLYLDKYKTFEEWIEDNFSFTPSYASKFMKVAIEFDRTNFPREIGLTKLYLITFVPEEKRDEIIGKVENKQIKTREDIEQEVKRMKSGTLPYYSDDPEEHKLKLAREGNNLINEINGYRDSLKSTLEHYKSLKESLLAEIGSWTSACRKYPSNIKLIELSKVIKKKIEVLE